MGASESTNSGKKVLRRIILCILCAVMLILLFVYPYFNRKAKIRLPEKGLWECKELNAVICLEESYNLYPDQTIENKPWHSFMEINGRKTRVTLTLDWTGIFTINGISEFKNGSIRDIIPDNNEYFKGKVSVVTDSFFKVKDTETGTEYVFYKTKDTIYDF